MKNKFKILVISLILGLFFGISAISLAQPGPPPPPDGHGQAGNQTPGGMAPVGSGLILMISMGAAYGAKKAFNAWRKIDE
jgi:hypothetical protein